MEVSLCTDEADVTYWWVTAVESMCSTRVWLVYVFFLCIFYLQIANLSINFSFLLAYGLTHVIILLSPNSPVCHSDGDVIMMLPVTRFKGQPAGMVTTTTPWLSVSTDPSPQWLWLASWSAATYQAMPPLVFYPPAVWIPEHAQLMQVTWHTWTDHRRCQTFVSWFIVCRRDLFEFC